MQCYATALLTESHFMTNGPPLYERRISLNDPRNSLYDRTHIPRWLGQSHTNPC
jgi:hypothetical protein